MRFYSYLILLSLLLTHPFQSVSAELFLPDSQIAEQSYKNKDYKNAYKHWKALEPYEDPKAYLGLGKLYAKGLGVPQDDTKSIYYFKKAAKHNNPKAFYEIGKAYKNGKGVPRDVKKAEKWFRLSSDHGYQRADIALSKIDPDYQPSREKIPNTKNKWTIKNSLKSQIAIEDNLSLGSDEDSLSAFTIEAKTTTKYQPIEDLSIQTQIRALHSTGSAKSINYNDNDDIMDESFLEIRQAYLKWKNINNIAPLSISIGRQRFSDDRRLWWNDELDAIKFSYNTSLTNGFLSLGHNFSNYRYGDDQEFKSDDKKRARVLGELTHKTSLEQALELRFLYEKDYSGEYDIGSFVKSQKFDRRDHNVLWLGARANGRASNNLYYDTSLIGVIGKETLTSSLPSGDLRRITNNDKNNVLGFAFDTKIQRPITNNTKLHFAYTFGSGDDGKGTNTSFRQTGLETNSSGFARQNWTSPTRHYGEILRPELSNIHILNFGVHKLYFDKHDLNINYFSYWRANNNTDIGRNGINQNLTDSGSHIGQALDITSTVNLPSLLPIKSPILDQSYLRLKASSFYSGDAFGAFRNELALSANAEIGIKF